MTSKRITLNLTGISMCQDPTIRYLIGPEGMDIPDIVQTYLLIKG
jgi:hypothetical protein